MATFIGNRSRPGFYPAGLQRSGLARATSHPTALGPRRDRIECPEKEGSRLFRFIRSRVGHAEDAEDVLQDILSELVEAERLMRPIDEIGAWLYRVIGLVAVPLLGGLVMLLWNWLVPPIFGWSAIGFWQALGLFLLARILVGGMHGHGDHPRWRDPTRRRRERMTPEERER
jgi:hypothetical protein